MTTPSTDPTPPEAGNVWLADQNGCGDFERLPTWVEIDRADERFFWSLITVLCMPIFVCAALASGAIAGLSLGDMLHMVGQWTGLA